MDDSENKQKRAEHVEQHEQINQHCGEVFWKAWLTVNFSFNIHEPQMSI